MKAETLDKYYLFNIKITWFFSIVWKIDLIKIQINLQKKPSIIIK